MQIPTEKKTVFKPVQIGILSHICIFRYFLCYFKFHLRLLFFKNFDFFKGLCEKTCQFVILIPIFFYLPDALEFFPELQLS